MAAMLVPRGIRPRLRLSIVLMVAALLAAGSGAAFFDELVALKAELAQWGAVHADADFSDILEQLDDISGTAFNDVSDDAWYAPYVTSLAEWGIVSGYHDKTGKATGEFGPGNPVTVAEILKMAAKASQIDEGSCPAPARHAEARDHWAAAYVGCAESRQARVLAAGYSAALDRPATRAEVLAVMHDLFGDDVPPVQSTFVDAKKHRFSADIAYASLLGIVSGDADSSGNATRRFRPDDAVNRAEAAKILVLRIKELAKRDLAATST